MSSETARLAKNRLLLTGASLLCDLRMGQGWGGGEGKSHLILTQAQGKGNLMILGLPVLSCLEKDKVQ